MESYGRTAVNELVSVPAFYTLHSDEYFANYFYAGESHDFWEFMYVEQGRIEMTVDGKTTLLKKNDVIFIAPNLYHSLRTFDEMTVSFIVTFECRSPAIDGLAGYIGQLDPAYRNILACISNEVMTTYYMPMYKRLIPKRDALLGGDQLIRTYIEQFVILLLRDKQPRNDWSGFKYKEAFDNQLCAQIISVLDRHLTDNISVTELAKQVGYSKTYISCLFKNVCGCSIAKYLVNQKIERAKVLIRYKRFSMTEISNALGFDNPQYFSRVFRRVTGVTPSAYEKSIEMR